MDAGGYWKDDYTLFSHALKVTRNNYMAHIHVGAHLVDMGNLDEALKHTQEAVAIKPGLLRGAVQPGRRIEQTRKK